MRQKQPGPPRGGGHLRARHRAGGGARRPRMAPLYGSGTAPEGRRARAAILGACAYKTTYSTA